MSEPLRSIQRFQLVALSSEDSFAFFADAYNLEAVTPLWLGFRILTPRPIAMREGTIIEYVLTTHGLPVRWRTEIVEWEPGRRFVDRQMKGPFSVWEHTHAFEERPDGTLIRDTVLCWGSFALMAAGEYGARVTGVTLSQQQLSSPANASRRPASPTASRSASRTTARSRDSSRRSPRSRCSRRSATRSIRPSSPPATSCSRPVDSARSR